MINAPSQKQPAIRKRTLESAQMISIFFQNDLMVGIHLYNPAYILNCSKYVANCSNVYPVIELLKMSG